MVQRSSSGTGSAALLDGAEPKEEMCVTTDRSREAAAFLATIADAPPDAVGACDGWTTHEIAADVTGIHAEVIRHLEPFLQGDPVPKTRSFEEREAPLQATDQCGALGTPSTLKRTACASWSTTSSTSNQRP